MPLIIHKAPNPHKIRSDPPNTQLTCTCGHTNHAHFLGFFICSKCMCDKFEYWKNISDDEVVVINSDQFTENKK